MGGVDRPAAASADGRAKPEASAGTARGLPLRDVLVVSLEQAVAAPFATRQLGDLGARVVKIERVGTGDFARWYDTAARGASTHFVWLNRGKESVELDLRDPDGRAVLERLLARADVFVQNMAPGKATALGLAAGQVTERHPRLVACDITGYGSDGPMASDRAYDLLIQCESAFVQLTGSAAEPAKAGVPVADIAAGMYAFAGILAALRERDASGRGRALEVSLFDALLEWMTPALIMTACSGRAPGRFGLAHSTIAPYGPYQTADGEVVVAVQNDREWRALCAVVLAKPYLAEHERFRTNELRVAYRGDLDAEIAGVTSAMTSDSLVERLEAAEIAHARVNTLAQVLEHSQLRARRRWRDVATPGGTVAMLAPPLLWDGDDPPMGPVPALGEHTAAVLSELET